MSLKDPEKRKEYNRKNYQAHHEREIERSRKYREAHREKRRAYNRKYFQDNKARLKEYKTKYIEENKEKFRQYRRQRTEALRRSVIDAYGAKCACCGETTFEFLTVDHVNGDGSSHRKSFDGSNRKVYLDIINRGFPEGFQVLCMNCNWSRGIHGYCPHDQARSRLSLDALDEWQNGRQGDLAESSLDSLPLFTNIR